MQYIECLFTLGFVSDLIEDLTCNCLTILEDMTPETDAHIFVDHPERVQGEEWGWDGVLNGG
jgi:hypothetical protein